MVDLLSRARWRVVRTPPGAAADPAGLIALDPAQAVSLPATVPGTAASAWRDQFGSAAALALAPDDWDWWFLADFAAEAGAGQPWNLHSDGIATYSTLWLNGVEIGSGAGAFDALDFPAAPQAGRNRLAIRCRPLGSVSTPSKPRARWRSSLIANGTLRWHRTPLLGHIPWHGTIPAVGPWAGISLSESAPYEVLTLRTELDGALGRVVLSVASDAPVELTLRLSHPDGSLSATEQLSVDGERTIAVELPEPQRWFPHSHGTPALYRLELHGGSQRQSFDVGFRSIEADRQDGGFQLKANGLPVFARGAVWAPLDALRLGGSPADYRDALSQLAEAGVNLVRISGTGSYEQPAFYRECDRLGIMVWQDCMLATLDPPEDSDWLDRFSEETGTWLTRLAKHPSIVVVSGGNETEQQPVFWGKSAEQRRMTVLDTVIPAIIRHCIPAAVAVSSSPSGPGNPVHARSGISHYFGVGAYRLGLPDARTSGVRFAAECLAFAVPPEPASIVRHFGEAFQKHSPPAASARWQAAVARDPGADWSFEDTAAHYVKEFFGTGSAAGTGRELDLHRAAVHHAVSRTLLEWRRPESPCAGALLLSARDLSAGAGFGVVDVDGVPKSAWYALKAACRPLALGFQPEGLNGVDLHLFNDRPEAVEGLLEIRIHGISGVVQAHAEIAVRLPGHGHHRWELCQALGGFLDLDHVWQFGERSYDTAEAVLWAHDGSVLARTVLLLGGIDRPLGDTGLQAFSGSDHSGDFIEVSSSKLASFVALDLPGRVPEDNYFHLPHGGRRRIACRPAPAGPATPQRAPESLWGTVRALNEASAPQPVWRLPENDINRGG